MNLPTVGLIGLGAMGLNVARALRDRGFEVVARDLVAAKEDEARSFGCRVGTGPAEVAAACDVLVTLVVDAAQTREVLGAIAPGPAPVVMMCSTVSPGDAESFAHGRRLLDAPISGGPVRARAGKLSVMAAGPDDVFEACRPVLEAMASNVFRMGARPGDGSRMKVVNNMLAAANLAAGCEALAMAALMGLDLRQAADVVQASSGASWIFGDRMDRALAGDATVMAAARVLLKDVGLFVEEARRREVEAPMAGAAQAIFRDTVERGYAEEDDSAVLRRYAQAWPGAAGRLPRGRDR